MPMMKYFSKQDFVNNKWYFLIGFLGLSFLFGIGSINGKFWGTDFEVYFYAAKAFLTGGEVYGEAFGNSGLGFYKYSPVVLFFYIPAGLLPFKVAVTINYFLLSIVALLAIFTATFVIVKQLFGEKELVKNKLLLIVFVLSVTFLNRDLLLGNVNTLMLLLICLGLLFSLKDKPILSGLLFALAVTFKPYLLIVLLPLLMNNKLKAIGSTVFFTCLLALFPFVFTGWSTGYQLYMDWFSAMMEHSNYIISPFTFDSITKQYLLPNSSFNFSIFFTAFLVSFYLIFKLVNHIKGTAFPNHASSKQLLVMEMFTLLALIPNLVNTDTQQLMYSIPLIALLIQFINTKPNRYLLIIYIVIFFFFSIDQPDILGRTLANTFYQMGLSGISNLLIIGMSWFIFTIQNNLFLEKLDDLTHV